MIVLSLATATGHARQSTCEIPAVTRFQAAVDDYLLLRERLEPTLPPLEVTADPHELLRGVAARSDAIRAARPDARAGDIFGDAADLFRVRIQTALQARAYDVEALLGVINEEWPRPTTSPVVHDRFLWCEAAVMPPWILDVLPPLPEGLQYRFVNRDLVLVDVGGDLVIDIVRDALPR
jgi:hypothetical protein